MQKVPAIKDSQPGQPDFNMFEAAAIMKYICASRKLDDHWYPTSPNGDLKLQAVMDIYMSWHHANIRSSASGYYFANYLSGIIGPEWAKEEVVQQNEAMLGVALDGIERVWLSPERKTKFMFGDKPSICDLFLATEIGQLMAVDYPFEKEYPSIHEWMMKHMLGLPGYKKIHYEGEGKLRYTQKHFKQARIDG